MRRAPFPNAGLPNSPSDWLRLARNHERRAQLCVDDKEAAGQVWDSVGFATEATLKAVIMHRERLNAWPEKESRPDLYVHSLRALAKIAGIEVSPAQEIAPAWKTVLDWERGHSYVFRPMPRRVAKSMLEAGFGERGVVPWLIGAYLPNV